MIEAHEEPAQPLRRRTAFEPVGMDAQRCLHTEAHGFERLDECFHAIGNKGLHAKDAMPDHLLLCRLIQLETPGTGG